MHIYIGFETLKMKCSQNGFEVKWLSRMQEQCFFRSWAGRFLSRLGHFIHNRRTWCIVVSHCFLPCYSCFYLCLVGSWLVRVRLIHLNVSQFGHLNVSIIFQSSYFLHLTKMSSWIVLFRDLSNNRLNGNLNVMAEMPSSLEAL